MRPLGLHRIVVQRACGQNTDGGPEFGAGILGKTANTNLVGHRHFIPKCEDGLQISAFRGVGIAGGGEIVAAQIVLQVFGFLVQVHANLNPLLERHLFIFVDGRQGPHNLDVRGVGVGERQLLHPNGGGFYIADGVIGFFA